MPKWSQKKERQYEKIKESSKERGVAKERAKEIAARTVNKRRREEGQTPDKRTKGTGKPTVPLEERSRDELYNRAGELNIRGRSKMKKEDLVSAIRERSG